MKQYIDKDALVAEIEKYRAMWDGMDGDYCKGRRLAYSDVISILNTLEVKEVDLDGAHYKPLDEDFERDAVSFCFDRGLNTTPHIAKTIAKHFFELGLKAQKGG